MASLSTCHLGLWLGWQILLNLVKCTSSGFYAHTKSYFTQATSTFEPTNTIMGYVQERTIVLKNSWLDASLRFFSLTNVAISRLESTQCTPTHTCTNAISDFFLAQKITLFEVDVRTKLVKKSLERPQS